MTDVAEAVRDAVRTARQEGVQPLVAFIRPEDSIFLATQVKPRPGNQKLGTGLAVDVDGSLITIYASQYVKAGHVQVFTMRMQTGVA